MVPCKSEFHAAQGRVLTYLCRSGAACLVEPGLNGCVVALRRELCGAQGLDILTLQASTMPASV